MASNPFDSNSFLSIAQKVVELKKTITFLPIVKKFAHCHCVLVGDDLGLRTTLTNPVGYDRELIKLLHAHAEISETDDGKSTKYNRNRFI